jgi:hypothetical protein
METDMDNTYPRTLAACALLALVSVGGCTTTPALDAKFGSTVIAAVASQALDPAAPSHAGPVVGLDGVAAANVVSRYHKSFLAPQPAPSVFAIGIASGATAAPMPTQQ